MSSGWDRTACIHELTAAVINPVYTAAQTEDGVYNAARTEDGVYTAARTEGGVYTAARTEDGLTRTHHPAKLLLTVNGFWEIENSFTSVMWLQVEWPCSSEWPRDQVHIVSIILLIWLFKREREKKKK